MKLLNNRQHQSGVALLLVLWACTLLAILLGGYAVLAHTEALQSRYQFAEAQAHDAAEAGIMRMFYGLHDPVSSQRWIGDGRDYSFTFGQATVKVSAVSEGGKVDINTASAPMLQNLFQVAGMAPPAAKALAINVVDWRNPLALANELADRRNRYKAAGLSYGPRNGPFATIQELQLVLGMPPTVYRSIAPYITLWSGNSSPDPNLAPDFVLQAIPGMTPERASEIHTARLNNASNPMLALDSGVTHSIRSVATLADGTRAVLRATMRLESGQNNTQPYAMLRWQEGDANE